MRDQADLLSRVKPLADPVRVITLLMVAGSGIIGVVAALLYARVYGIYGVLMGLPLAGIGISYALLIGPIGRPNAIYLRAFRTDRSTAKLRASGKKFGYTFAFSKCSKVKVKDHEQVTDFEITAVPDVADGHRGFCIDTSDQIMVDPSGGTNCTQPLQ